VQRLSYNFFTQLYAVHSSLDSISNRLEWSGVFLPSKTTELTIGTYLLQSQINGATVDYGLGQVTTIGRQSFWGVGANELLNWQIDQNHIFKQGATFSTYIPTTTGVDPNYTVSLDLAIARVWGRDAFAGRLQLAYYRYGETRGPTKNNDGTVDPDGVVSPLQQQIGGQFLFDWRHDFQHFWNINLAAGVATVFRAEDGGGQIWQPAGTAAAHYTHPKVQLDLIYNRGLIPNAVVQRTFVGDTLALRGTVPFGERSKLALSGGASYVHYQEADTFTGDIGTKVNLFYVDATLTWAPIDWLVVFSRYSYQNQLADDTQRTPIASIERHQVMLGLTATYPPRPAAVVPQGPAVRVDKADVEPIPDVHSAVIR
jgi:hypothetical protein